MHPRCQVTLDKRQPWHRPDHHLRSGTMAMTTTKRYCEGYQLQWYLRVVSTLVAVPASTAVLRSLAGSLHEHNPLKLTELQHFQEITHHPCIWHDIVRHVFRQGFTFYTDGNYTEADTVFINEDKTLSTYHICYLESWLVMWMSIFIWNVTSSNIATLVG